MGKTKLGNVRRGEEEEDRVESQGRNLLPHIHQGSSYRNTTNNESDLKTAAQTTYTW